VTADPFKTVRAPRTGGAWRSRIIIALLAAPLLPAPLLAQVSDSAMVRLLKSGQVPDERQGTLIGLIGKQGSEGDLRFLFDRVLDPDGFSTENRQAALEALLQAERNRRVKPEGDLSGLTNLLNSEAPEGRAIRLQAIRLAGLWGVDSAAEALQAIATAPDSSLTVRREAIEALLNIDADTARSAIEALAAPERPLDLRVIGVAALAELDPQAAAGQAVAILQAGAENDRVLKPLLQAFLERQAGIEALAAAVSEKGLDADAAKLALRSMYALGRSDAPLVEAFSRAAGLNADPAPPTEAEIRQLEREVAERGDPHRGEQVFRRPDLNCLSCHAVAKAGGDVGPDLSAIGASSPVDYLIRSLLIPEESVKEEFEVKAVLTADGEIVQGIVEEESDERLVLKQADGSVRVIPAAEIEDERSGGSLMPNGLGNLMTRSEMVDLLSFLSQLGKPGPFAIRSTPTIQRWRLLPLPEAESALDPNDSADRLLWAASAAESDWLPCYAKVDGRLPLAEAAELARSTRFILRGAWEVSKPGEVTFALEAPASVQRIWIDGEPVELSERITRACDAGLHQIELLVDLGEERNDELRVELRRPEGSSAEFTVVGGP